MSDGSLGHPRLVQAIREEIRESGPCSFARFMELALHHTHWGYYAAGSERLGECGDFITASDLGPAFGRALARQVMEFDRWCDAPEPFDLIEFGAGRGLLARDVHAALEREAPALAARLRYTAVDTSVGMRRSIREQAPQSGVHAEGPRRTAARGCILAVEFFDALPVHRVTVREGRLQELGVDWDGEKFVEVPVDPGRDVLAWVERYAPALGEGAHAEVCLALDDQFGRFDATLEHGFILVLDYGDTADRLVSAERSRGTLLAYHAHRSNEDYLQRIGRQDLTAHVNFTALEDAAAARGWRHVGGNSQDRFLIANGILEEFERMDEPTYRDPRAIQQRQHIKRLIEPLGMGRMFQVRVFARGLDPQLDLAGLGDPFHR